MTYQVPYSDRVPSSKVFLTPQGLPLSKVEPKKRKVPRLKPPPRTSLTVPTSELSKGLKLMRSPKTPRVKGG